jgi:hypothetical protein
MAQSIALIAKYMAILDELYKVASLTARLDAKTKPVDFAGANVVKVFKTSLNGLGDMTKSGDYPVREINATWETLTLATMRGAQFKVGKMENEETLGMAFGTVAGEFIRTQVAPEVDAYRFSKYSSWSGIEEVGTPATLTNATVLAALDVATGFMNGAEVPPDGRVLFVSDTVQTFLNQALTRFYGNDTAVSTLVTSYNNMPVIMVPQTRFYKGITLEAGASASAAGGYSKTTSTGRDLNFMMIHPQSVLQATKLDEIKVFDPAVVQNSNNWLFDYCLYHDAFVYENKVDGVYSHIKGS